VVLVNLAAGAEKGLRVGRWGEGSVDSLSFEINRVETEIADVRWECERRPKDSAAE
jgi:hypothetical protein